MHLKKNYNFLLPFIDLKLIKNQFSTQIGAHVQDLNNQEKIQRKAYETPIVK